MIHLHLSAASIKIAKEWLSRPVWTAACLFVGMTPFALAVTPCASLARISLPDTTITLARSETATTFKPGVREAEGPPLKDLPDFCRVAGEIRPTSDSRIKFEVWMPSSGWNGKFMGVGNGGWSGEIWYPPMGAGLREGYATASTDTGHEGSFKDAQFALEHPEKVVDFGYRAVHEMTVKAKLIIAEFYGGAPRLSFWEGCSSGGKQGLKEAQRFPADYDGIVAGAPANHWVHLAASGVWIWQSNHDGTARVLSKDKLQLLHKAALDACDSRDGVTDGVIDDPRSCHLQPEILACKGAATAGCLTGREVEAAKRIYGGPKDPRSGDQVFPGLEPGSELNWWMFGSESDPPIVASHFRYLVFKDPAWTAGRLNFGSDIDLADRLDGGLLTATDPDLSPFFAHGGKLILYHGWTDPLIAPRNTIDYFKSVSRASGKSAGNSVRLFMAPGMDHCAGGSGPSSFNATRALSDWVEKGEAPEQMIAARWIGDPAAHKSDRTRPLCAYPKVAHYKGSGSTDEASSFACRE